MVHELVLRQFRMREDRGAIAVVVAIFAVVAFGFAALVVDMGYAQSVKARAQDAADSAALAAAAELYASGDPPKFAAAANAAKANAEDVLGLGPSAWAGCTDPAPLPGKQQGGCVSFDSVTDPRQVRVHVGTSVGSFFGGVFGYGGMTISAAAVASLGAVEFSPECAICVLAAGPHVLQEAEVRAESADISFNGDVELLGTSSVTAVQRTVFLGGTFIGSSSGFGDALVIGADAIEDPLEDESVPPAPPPLVEPIPPALPAPLPRVDPCDPDPVIGGPGVYGTVELVGDCDLQDGTYVVTGRLTAAPGAIISGGEVQFWLQGGSIDLSNASTVDLSAPANDSLVYAPSGTPTLTLFGTTSNSITGHINAPGGSITGGDSCLQSTVNGLIVVAELDVGTGQCLVSTASTSRETEDPEPPVLIR